LKGGDESLGNFDPVRPGEQWFFYWKTSAALWEGKILETPAQEVIFIPIYWGFHLEGNGVWDFGNLHPERDLGRLVRLLTQHRRKFAWIIPLTPAPFFPNGGVPVPAALSLSISHEGPHIACLDQEKKLNKIFSFFEPKVFNHFSAFLKSLAEFFTSQQIKSNCWGATFSYFQDGKKWSYFYDRSNVFEQGFSRYIKRNRPEEDLSLVAMEEILKSRFSDEFQELYLTTAEGHLGPFWRGVQDILVLGGSPKETLERGLAGGKTQFHYFRDLFQSYVRDQWVSTCLLGADEKNQLLPAFLKEHMGQQMIDQRYHYQILSGELSAEMRPFGLVDIFCPRYVEELSRMGLLSYLEKNYPWMYQIHQNLNFTTEWIEANQHKVKFFSAKEMDRLQFAQMIKLFMMGQQILLDSSGLHPDLDKKLQIFYLENNLAVQNVNYLTNISIASIGDGKLIVINGDSLINHPENEKFWQHIFRYMNLSQPETLMDEDVFGLWRIRSASQADLNYLDVRRVNLYNPTSYKKRVNVRTKKHFAFMKMVSPLRAEAKSTPEGVEVELLPYGMIGLDFGHYEEN
jgi:hypothetical protein